jgi:hypothetical protein
MPDIKPFRAFIYGDKYRKKIGRLGLPSLRCDFSLGPGRLCWKKTRKILCGWNCRRATPPHVMTRRRNSGQRMERVRGFYVEKRGLPFMSTKPGSAPPWTAAPWFAGVSLPR